MSGGCVNRGKPKALTRMPCVGPRSLEAAQEGKKRRKASAPATANRGAWLGTALVSTWSSFLRKAPNPACPQCVPAHAHTPRSEPGRPHHARALTSLSGLLGPSTSGRWQATLSPPRLAGHNMACAGICPREGWEAAVPSDAGVAILRTRWLSAAPRHGASVLTAQSSWNEMHFTSTNTRTA